MPDSRAAYGQELADDGPVVRAGSLAVVAADGAPQVQRAWYTVVDSIGYIAVAPVSLAATYLRDDARICLVLGTPGEDEETIGGIAEPVTFADEAEPVLASIATVAPKARVLFRVISTPVVPPEALEDPAERRLLVQAIFSDLPHNIAGAMAHRLQYQSFAAGDVVIKQGTQGDHFFIVVDGEVDVVHEHPTEPDEILVTLGPGESFGESALLLNTPRTATVRARTSLRVLALDKHTFERVVLLSGQEDAE